jgi:hypothetical protein
MARPKEADLGLTDVYEIERSTRTGDETYSPSGSKAATGFESDEDEYESENDELEELEDGSEAERTAQPAANGKVDYMA